MHDSQENLPMKTAEASGSGPAHRYSAELASSFEGKWQSAWETEEAFQTPNPGDKGFDPEAERFYCLDMFPYPSGAGLHVGHPVGYIGSDIICRYRRMLGQNVLHPMGWDAFGLPAEQYAIATGVHPQVTTANAIETFRRQLKQIGFSYDWSREFATMDESYYKWTQWIWLQAWSAWYDNAADRARPIQELVEALDAGTLLINADGEVCAADGDLQNCWPELSQQEKRQLLDGKRLAYIDEQIVNWCPKLGTVLANEEVIDGRSERGGHPVLRRPLRQWMFRITAYAGRLLDSLEDLDWPESTRMQQTTWIGRSEGADLHFPLIGIEGCLDVFTTRPDTIFGATFMVIAPEHPLVERVLASKSDLDNRDEILGYVEAARNRSDVDRMADSKTKTGVLLGIDAVNPATKDAIPIWIADYVLMGYGHGAVMAVPGHDERDHEFATQFDLPILEVVEGPENQTDGCWSGNGIAIHSSSGSLKLDGLSTTEAKDVVIKWAETEGHGHGRTTWRLRDWLFSRQRYWGEPFPIVHTEDGAQYPVSSGQLPVSLPSIDDYAPVETDDPQPLLGKVEEWIHTTAGEAGVDPDLLAPDTPVRREANTMPGWAGSCWYYVRFCDPHNNERFVGREAEQYWLGPKESSAGGVDLYIGGAEHAVLHLLYARFWNKLLHDLGHLSSDEPFRRLFHQGLLTSFAWKREDGSLVPVDEVDEEAEVEKATNAPVERIIAKMSKSLRNVVNPDDVIRDYGADTLRLYEMYMGPLEASKPWNTRDIIGVFRFLQRVWRLVIDEETGKTQLVDIPDESVERLLHRTTAKVSDDIEKMAYNTAIAAMIEFVNAATQAGGITANQLDRLSRVLCPFAPHIAEELRSRLGCEGLCSTASWPEVDPAMLKDQIVVLPVQISGKVRARIEVPTDAGEEEVTKVALAEPTIASLIEGDPRKVIVIPGRIVNIIP